MIKKIVVLTAAVALSASVAMAYSGPDRLIPAPVEYSFGGGVYTLRGDGSDVKVSLGGKCLRSDGNRSSGVCPRGGVSSYH